MSPFVKRFYKTVEVIVGRDGHEIALDGKPLVLLIDDVSTTGATLAAAAGALAAAGAGDVVARTLAVRVLR